MISNEDIASAQAAYDELLASDSVPFAIIQRPDRTKDSTGAANAGGWTQVGIEPVIIEEMQNSQSAPLGLRNDNEVKESAYILIFAFDSMVQVGDRIIVLGDRPYDVRMVPRGRAWQVNTEAVGVQTVRPSDNG